MADTTPPVLPGGRTTGQASAAGTTATIKFSADEGGTFYYVAMPEGADEPTAAAIKAEGARGAAVAGINTIFLEELAPGAGYTVYIVLADAAGNLSVVLGIPVSPRHIGDDPAKDRAEQNEAALITAGEIVLTVPRAGGGNAQIGITFGEDGIITIVIDGSVTEYPYTISGDTIIVVGGGSGGGDAKLGFVIGEDGTLTLVGLDELADGGLAGDPVVSDPNPHLIPPEAPPLAGTPTPILRVAEVSFDGAGYGDERPEAKTITITNSGTGAAAISAVALSGPGKDAFALGGGGDTVAAGSSIATWTVQPAADLAVGSYTATITVSYDGEAAATAQVSITISKAAGTVVGTPGGDSVGTTITVTALTVDNDEQEPEYAISTVDTAPDTGWQASTSFTGLDYGVTYYVYARAGASANYGAGAAVRSAAITVGKLSQAAFVFGEETVSKTYGDSDATYTATGGSGDGGISYAVTGGADVISVDAAGGAVSFLKAGTGYITATRAGDATYNAVTATLTVTVAKRLLTGTAQAEDRVYDGKTAVTVSITAGNKVGSDAVFITATGTADSANVGSRTVTISNISLSGAAKDNYTAPGSIANTTVTISKRALDGTAEATDRVYDGTTAVTVTITPINKVGSDVVFITATGTADNANAGSRFVTISNIALSGAAKDNYTAPESIANTKVTVTKRLLTVTKAQAADRAYDSTTAAVTVIITAGNKVGSDDVSIMAMGTADSANVGTGRAVTISSIDLTGNAAGNYDPPEESITGLTVTISKAVPVYTPPTLTAFVGQTLADLVFLTGSGFSWDTVKNPLTTAVGGVGSTTFIATYTPFDTDNYLVVPNIQVDITVELKPLAITVSLNLRHEVILTGEPSGGITLSGDGTATISAKGYTNVKWYVDGVPAAGAALSNGGDSITLKATDYDARRHQVLFRGVQDGSTYSKEISFTVSE